MSDCIFCKIANKEVPKEFTYIDEDIMVFPDINPVKPIHLLIMPKTHIPDFLDLKDQALMIKLNRIVGLMVKKMGLEDKGYRLVVHGGGAQAIDHLHTHLLGPMGKAAKM